MPSCGVCLSVMFVSCVKTNKDIFEIFSPPGSQAILVFRCQTGWRYSDGNPLTGASNAGGVGKKRDSGRISGFDAYRSTVLSTVRVAKYEKQVVSIIRIETICGPPKLPSFHNSFPVIRTANAKNRRFHVPQPTFLFHLETPLRLSRNVLHGWKGNSMLAKPLAACSYLSSIVSELYDA